MDNILLQAIETCKEVKSFYVKYIAANDTKATNSHQYGYHIHKEAWNYFLAEPGIKGQNIDVPLTIRWQNDFETQSHFKYYGVGTRNEYRITQFQRAFPFREDENIGDLLVICKRDIEYYDAFVLSADEDIEYFLTAFNISQVQIGGVVTVKSADEPENPYSEYFRTFIENTKEQFPSSLIMAEETVRIAAFVDTIGLEFISADPDNTLLKWIQVEYDLFRAFEKNRYSDKIGYPFKSVDELIDFSNTILNRRKSRAGKSLEHHLAHIFNACEIQYEQQVITEANKKPDFIFPGSKQYRNMAFKDNELFFLGAKTTCKDRWRQILNEADRIKVKHLMTLQQGISGNQLAEMKRENVVLVVPAPYLSSFPQDFRSDILTLSQFIKTVGQVQRD